MANMPFDLGSLDPQKLIQLAMQYDPIPVLDELSKGPTPPFTSMMMPQAGAATAPNVQPSFADMLYGGGTGSPQALVETSRPTSGTPMDEKNPKGAAALNEKQMQALQSMLPQNTPHYAPAAAPTNLYRPGQMMTLPGGAPPTPQMSLAAILNGRR